MSLLLTQPVLSLWLAGRCLPPLLLLHRGSELFWMPAYVIKDAWLPVLRLELTSILIMGNPHKLLRENLEGGGSSCWGLSSALEKLHRKCYNSSLVQILWLNICVLFYRGEAFNITCSQESLSFRCDLHHKHSRTHNHHLSRLHIHTAFGKWSILSCVSNSNEQASRLL